MTTAMAFFSHASCASLTAPPTSSRLSATPSSLASSSSLLFAGGRGRGLPRRRPSPPHPTPPSAGGGALGCRCLFGLGVPELVVIAGVAALVFGPKKLPEIGRSIGKTVKSFQQAAKEFETELKKEPEDSESSKSASDEDERKELETSGSKDS